MILHKNSRNIKKIKVLRRDRAYVQLVGNLKPICKHNLEKDDFFF